MANWKRIQSGYVGGAQAIDATSSTAKFPLGVIMQAKDLDSSTDYGAGEFIYLKGVASTVVGSVVTFNRDDHSTALLAANAKGPVGIAMSANVANQYGWYQIRGKAVAKVLASFADNADVYATSTAGSVDDAVVSGDVIVGAKSASAIGTPSTGLAEVEIDNPFVFDGVI